MFQLFIMMVKRQPKVTTLLMCFMWLLVDGYGLMMHLYVLSLTKKYVSQNLPVCRTYYTTEEMILLLHSRHLKTKADRLLVLQSLWYVFDSALYHINQLRDYFLNTLFFNYIYVNLFYFQYYYYSFFFFLDIIFSNRKSL